MDGPSGLIAAASYALLSLSKWISGFSVQAEHFVVLFFVSGLLLLLKALDNNKWHSFLGAGVLICISFMIKQNGLFFLLFGGVILLIKYLLQKPRSMKRLLINGSVFSLGAIAVIAVFVFVIFMQHALADMWKWIYTIPKSYTSLVTFKKGMQYFQDKFSRLFSDYPVFQTLTPTPLREYRERGAMP